MDEPHLTGAQKSYLRGLGQRMEPTLKAGKSGLTPAFFIELERQLHALELVKLRFLGPDRKERAALCDQIAATGRCVCAGAVGHTALFFRRNPDPAKQRVEFPA